MKRVLCMVAGHKWSRHRYESGDSDDQSAGHFLKCLRCGKLDEEISMPPGAAAGGFL